MKKTCTIIAATCIVASGMASSRTFINPDFEHGGLSLAITAVERADSHTRVQTDIYGPAGNWVRADTNIYLQGRHTGRKYRMLSLQGMNPGEKTVLGDSAFISATMTFEPIAPADSIIDFIEPDGWAVTGIKLYDEPLKRVHTHIEGTVEDRPQVSWLILSESGSDHRVNKSIIIPVRDGRFHYDLYSDGDRYYELTPGIELMRGSWSFAQFYPEKEPVVIKFPSAQSNGLIEVTGGPNTTDIMLWTQTLNELWKTRIGNSDIEKHIMELYESDRLFTPEFADFRKHAHEMSPDSAQAIYQRLQKENRIKSPEGIIAEARRDSLVSAVIGQFYTTELRKPSICHLFQIYTKLQSSDKYSDTLLEIFHDNYVDTLTESPYHRMLTTLYEAGEPTPGKKYVDFSAPDLNGNIVSASEVIGGKIAVIDLWASWCGPCRRHSMALIPLYEKYRDKGFTVLGVAREASSDKAMRKAIERDGYPWINLIELNDTNNIWKKYRAGNAGGRIVLVDSNGTILAVDPETDEIEAHLSRLLD